MDYARILQPASFTICHSVTTTEQPSKWCSRDILDGQRQDSRARLTTSKPSLPTHQTTRVTGVRIEGGLRQVSKARFPYLHHLSQPTERPQVTGVRVVIKGGTVRQVFKAHFPTSASINELLENTARSHRVPSFQDSLPGPGRKRETNCGAGVRAVGAPRSTGHSTHCDPPAPQLATRTRGNRCRRRQARRPRSPPRRPCPWTAVRP